MVMSYVEEGIMVGGYGGGGIVVWGYGAEWIMVWGYGAEWIMVWGSGGGGIMVWDYGAGRIMVWGYGAEFAHPTGYYLSPPYCSPPELPAASALQISAQLENRELWEKFNAVGTEMILTKNGRRMFPEFCVSLFGLDPHSHYSLCVQAVPDGENRYKWRDGAWSMSGRAEPGPPTRLYLHPESPAPGHRWMERSICFSKIRLTNKTLSQGGQIVLQSMHRYYLRLHIINMSNNGPHARPASSISFPETSFIAVTSYQNSRLSLLKIEENPFAKGIKYFKSQQEHSTPRTRRKRPGMDEEESAELKRHKESAAELTGSQRDSHVETLIVLDENTEEKNESVSVSGESSVEEEERQAVSEKREEEREKRQRPGKESPGEGDIRHMVDPTCGDPTHHDCKDGREERPHRTDSLVQWDPITQRPMWASPSAISQLPLTACPISHRLAHPPSSALAPFSSPISNLAPVAPYYMGSWASPPVRLSYPLSALQPPFLQQMWTPPWYLPTHATSRGL
ncbi:T-box-containing protein TBX6L-like [Eleutherodactylus coqui]|uniref:T-box-containing protein TBX6L-like n=1 Tax=Eleutherodactylus coqui TaxID=57060 RepID=UPI003462962F